MNKMNRKKNGNVKRKLKEFINIKEEINYPKCGKDNLLKLKLELSKNNIYDQKLLITFFN